MSDSITIINEGDQKVVKVVRLTRPDEGTGFDAATLAETIHAATEKVSIADDDEVSIADSAATYGLKRWKWSTIAAAISSLISSAITALSLGNAATKNVGTTANTVAAGDDSRLSDARTPTAHKTSHATGGADAIAPSDIGAANASHTHVQADVTGLRTSDTPTFAAITHPWVDFFRPRIVASGNAGFRELTRSGHNWVLEAGDGTTIIIARRDSSGIGEISMGSRLKMHSGNSPYSTDCGIFATGDGEVEINNGTAGTRRNLTVQDLTATRYLRPASYTVAAANALVGVPTGAVVTISNETGGMVLAQYNGSAWKRQTDLATIS